MKRKLNHVREGMILVAPLLLGGMIFNAIPFGMVIRYSLTRGAGNTHRFVGIQNYRNILENEIFQLAFGNTLKFLAIALPLVLVVAFACKDKVLSTLAGIRMRPSASQRALLKDVLRECRQSFESRLDDPFDHLLVRAKDAPIGSEQMIGCYLTELIVSLLRQRLNPFRAAKKTVSTPLLDAMVAYMEQNLSTMLSLDALAEEFHVSVSCVKRLFSQYKQTGAMQFFTGLKIEWAKKLLREKEQNISQITEILGYDNSHYFYNRFKKFTGMSPLEYRHSVNAINPQSQRSSKG